MEKCKRVIFLDIDGVISLPSDGEGRVFNLEKQKLLGIILEKTDAKIVISSSWRRNDFPKTIQLFTELGFLYCDKIIDITIRASHYLLRGIHLSIPRGVEIKQWLDIHAKCPWISNPDKTDEFRSYDNDNKFLGMKSLELGIDYNYVIIDNRNDMLLEHQYHLVQCDGKVGLTINDVNKAIEILLDN